ncbi:NADH dehydrogenase (ubiquinone) complex I, assembly factor 1 [Orbilia brochopaga]|uniref:NADH dehydrogenase (Ubiquinone) complex I, assembly factor 1 n=1 Tax=Orbilia brochopaga TaxID=3140254 RepID=A0AAV9V0L8_9PEZI
MFRPTFARLYQEPGFWRRSLMHLRWETKKILDGAYIAPKDEDLYLFNADDAVTRDRIVVMTDQSEGGHSTADFAIVEEQRPADPPPPPNTPSYRPTIPRVYGIFHGTISSKLPNQKNRPDVNRSGYAGFKTAELGRTILGKRNYDLDRYHMLAMRVKTDHRTYFINVQTDGISEDALHQHRLFVRRPGEWETIVIQPDAFVRTLDGVMSHDQTAMITRRITTVGFSTTDRIEGPFKLCVHSIWATNQAPADAVEAVEVDGKREWLDWGHGVPIGDGRLY